MSQKPSVLFVCLGNICRSPLAEAAFRARAEEAGLDVETDSVGTAGYHIGEPPDLRSIAEAANHGIDISGYRGRQLSADDYTRFTHILALDHSNLADIRERAPANSTAKIALLLDQVPTRKGSAVDDPYHDGADMFALTWKLVDEAAKALVAELRDGSD
ncbi:low molecular weight protein-tyrosine-phosphatase [Qipengyuania atrilutea]|uniref:protein-tyrosine-phosphatase n=1 Tax=Qipengyuania atrilutea TaxID=2744473 RepID=A0A850H2T1_9SPHN|nr:low molecular weight protein-tyrosine-phosphatase [Actirhodobacter atriluteus]NVD44208.1 low molecular weight phosphotyrosine protein phosphatase [Actirhodobacter atriluteus]